MSNNIERYVFNTEWFDQPASLIRNYLLTYYPEENQIEMFDVKNKRQFLKKTSSNNISIQDLYIGSIITVYSRQLKIVEYADVFTRQRFEKAKERTFAMIKPDAYLNMGKIIDIIEKSELRIVNMKLTKLSKQDAESFYAEHRGKPFFETLINFITSDYVIGLELVGDGAIQYWRNLIGPTNSLVAKDQQPNSIRALYGTDGTQNACHGSDSSVSSQRELNFFFGPQSSLVSQPVLNNCTCCLIKPHSVQQRNIGKIIDIILREGFEISAMKMIYIDKPTSEEFLEIYKGVLPEFNKYAENYTTGPLVALEVRQENAVESFRALCGPHDPEIGRTIRKNTIRSLFGIDILQNAVHCTDLAEDGQLECEYFFLLLEQQ